MGLTLCLAILIHGILILGIGFAAEEPPRPHYDSMEIILVQQKDKQPPEEAKILAQANLDGGGETREDVTPTSPVPPPFPDTAAQVSAPPSTESRQATAEQQAPEQTPGTPKQGIDQLAAENKAAESTRQRKSGQSASTRPKQPRPSATALLNNSFRIAALSAEIRQKLEARAQRLKRKFVYASTQEYRYAAYMEAWRAKVERIGNLNYPEAARTRKLSGNLILDVALNPDGDIRQITIRRSSGHKILDDAAVRIVRLAAPFAPFPDGIKKDTDILHITRTWQFLDNNRGFR